MQPSAISPVSRRSGAMTVFKDEGEPPDGDAIIFRGKPNPILYWIEAPRMIVLPLLCLNVVVGALLHITRGAPVVFLVELTFLLDCILCGISILVMMLGTIGMEFLVTKDTAIVRFSPLGIGNRRFSIPIEDVAGIEVRSYGPRYGSVYLERYEASARLNRNVKRARGNGSIWLSLPWSWPPFVGFYGFRNYNQFAELIVSLRNEAQSVRSDES